MKNTMRTELKEWAGATFFVCLGVAFVYLGVPHALSMDPIPAWAQALVLGLMVAGSATAIHAVAAGIWKVVFFACKHLKRGAPVTTMSQSSLTDDKNEKW